MPVETSSIEGLLVLGWPTHDDDRGFFRQTHQLGELRAALGRDVVFRQGNHARSHPGVLRGFHAEPWDKLVYVTRGRVMAALADVRPDSSTFGEVATFHLGDPGGPHGAERLRLFIPEGVANSYCCYGDEPADYLYDVTAEWTPDVRRLGVAWDDPDLAVDWPVDHPVLSDPDRGNPTLRELYPDHPRWG